MNAFALADSHDVDSLAAEAAAPATPVHRVVLLSGRQPTCSARDVLDVCHGYPDRKTQAGVRGKLIGFAEQFVVLLEGPRPAVSGLAERIARDVPEAGMTVRSREEAEGHAFTGWSLGDLYLDEVRLVDDLAADELTDLLVDLLADTPAPAVAADIDASAEPVVEEDEPVAETEPVDPFAAIATLVKRCDTPAYVSPRREAAERIVA